jgi:hypothetical protein
MTNLTETERLIELAAICKLKARRDHALDAKDWALYAALHTENYISYSIGAEPIVGGKAAADTLAMLLENVTTCHHSHTPEIDFQDRDHATGIWTMEDNLFFWRDGQKQWIRGFGFYHEDYVREADGEWRCSARRLDRLHVETTPGARAMAVDRTGENTTLAVG